MVTSMSVGAYFAYSYMKSPEFERNLKNKLMGDITEKMKKQIPLEVPKMTGPSLPL